MEEGDLKAIEWKTGEGTIKGAEGVYTYLPRVGYY